jgi:hypothetical protein
MDITKLTQDKKDAILNVDSLLRIAGLPSYTELVESRSRIVRSASNTEATQIESDLITLDLLRKSQKALSKMDTQTALAGLATLIGVFAYADAHRKSNDV